MVLTTLVLLGCGYQSRGAYLILVLTKQGILESRTQLSLFQP